MRKDLPTVQLDLHGVTSAITQSTFTTEMLVYVDIDNNGQLNDDDVTAWATAATAPDYDATDAELGRPVTLYAYDPAGNLISETDANGNTTEYWYDERSRLTRIIEPADDNSVRPVTKFEYDDAGQLIG